MPDPRPTPAPEPRPTPAPEPRPTPADEAYWREYLTRGDDVHRLGRRLFTLLPSDPRCRLCTAPFAGAGGRVMRLMGRRPSDGNPNVCTACRNALLRHHGGAEVEGTMLFADIRGSTTLAEEMSAAAFHELLERFYRAASRAVFDHDGAIDKFVGDELVAMFYPALSGERHVARAVEAAQALLRATGHGGPDAPWVPVGAGVHSGRVWFGAVGEEPHVELTALGDPVNVTARLAAAAGPGEILVTIEAARAAGLDGASEADPESALERRSMQLKGKHDPIEVLVLGVGSGSSTSATVR